LTLAGGLALGADGIQASEAESAFLRGIAPHSLWLQTIEAVGGEWPIVSTVAPDLSRDPPGPGLVRSAWFEVPPDADGAEWHPLPRRQRVVARIRPVADGAWVDTVVETATIGTGDDTDGLSATGAGGVAWAWNPSTASAGIGALAVSLVVADAAVVPLPDVPVFPAETWSDPAPRGGPPWAGSRFPRVSRTLHKLLADQRHFYDDEALVCMAAAFGAGALMANTGFDTTVQTAWQQSVTPTDLGKFFSGCKDIGEGRYALSVFGAAAATGLILEGRPTGDVIGEWGSRSLRMFVVGAAPVYVLQLATGASRPGESPAGSKWHFFNDNNGVSGHAFVGAIPFLAAAEMAESPWAKGGLLVCSTFVAFSRVTDNAHYPSQAFLGWYLAWASAVAVDRTEWRYAGMDISLVPMPMADLGGMSVEARW